MNQDILQAFCKHFASILQAFCKHFASILQAFCKHVLYRFHNCNLRRAGRLHFTLSMPLMPAEGDGQQVDQQRLSVGALGGNN